MPAFEYQALDASGQRRRGVEEGETARAVRAQLRAAGLVPVVVEALDDAAAGARDARVTAGRPRRSSRGVPPLVLALTTRQLATLARASLPVEEALGTVARQVEHAGMKRVLLGVRARVLEGQSLAAALGGFPRVFPDIYRTTVAAGEAAGRLEAVLERLADYLERRHALRQKISLALVYPVLLTVIAIAVTVALLVYVVPQVVQVFSGTDQTLPMITRVLLALSGFLQAYGLALLAGLVVMLVVLRWIWRHAAWRRRLQAAALATPVLGRLLRGIETARFARTLAIFAASGVPLLEGLRSGTAVIGLLPMREAVEDAAQRIREGSGIGRALEASGHFTPMTVHLIKSGEASGRLPEMLERAAEAQERELEARIAVAMGLFEPLLIVTMGAVVLAIVLAILLPIFELNQLIT